MKNVLFVVSTLILMAGCTPTSSNDEPKRQAPADLGQSLNPTGLTEGITPTDKGLLTLQKASLGKAFLMSPTLVIANSSPILDPMQPMVVMFEKSGTQLGLFEMNIQAYYQELPVDKLIQTFDVISENEKEITFQWKYGLQFVSQKDISYYSDSSAEDNGDPGKADESVVPVVSSFVRSMSVQDNTLYIEQVARLRGANFVIASAGAEGTTPVDVTASDATVHMNVRITPYVMNPNFKPKESELAQGIGFFEQFSWSRQAQRKVIQAKRWDFSPNRSPLVYALTKNTPEDYVNAVKEGVLYWNKVIGREVIKVETGADPREPARDRRILVHWIDWLDAGFARAGMQADPFTGEMISGNVYMTSVFVLGGRMTARQESRTAPVRYVGMSGFQSSIVCHRDLDFDLSSLDASVKVSEERTKMVAQDYVRATVAHEVGHTLGLRHNFAGTLDSQLLDAKELQGLQKKYLAGELSQGAQTTTTVMDYDATLEAAMTGARLLLQALPYDLAAMDWAYIHTDSKAEDLKAPPFCTDGQLGKKNIVVGCQQFDSGRSPLLAKSVGAQIARDNVGVRFMRLAITNLRPLREPIPSLPSFYKKMNQVNLDERLGRILAQVKDLRMALLNTAEHQTTYVELGPKGWVNEAQWTARNTEILKQSWAELGGLSQLLLNALPIDSGALQKGWLLNQVNAALATDEARTGVSLDGVSYELTAAEREALKNVTQTFAKNFEEKYVAQVLKYFNLTEKDKLKDKEVNFDAHFLSADDEARVGDLIVGLLSASESHLAVKLEDKSVNLEVARYPIATRLLAVNLLSPKAFGKADWTLAARNKLGMSIVSRFKSLGLEGHSILEVAFATAKSALSDEAKAVIMEDLQILKVLEGFQN